MKSELPPLEGPSVGSTWKHVKTGGIYTVLALAWIEATLEPSVVYEAMDGKRWVRPVSEFTDGRFVPRDDEPWYKFSGPVHGWFSLSYSAYLVWPRLAMQSMPLYWQQRFVALADEINERFRSSGGDYIVQRRGKDGQFEADPWSDYRRGDADKLNEVL